MRHATFAQWSQTKSIIHALDPRVKLIVLFCFVVSLALIPAPSPLQLSVSFLALISVVLAARLPLLSILKLSLVSVPVVGLFALVVYSTGDSGRAGAILAKSYLSAFSVLLAASTTTLPRLMAAGHYFRVPDLLLEVTQVIYRYFFLISQQVHQMQIAFRSRGGHPGSRALRASSGMIAVLFARSYSKAVMVHQAMLGRGFSGRFPRVAFAPLTSIDVAALTTGFLFALGLYFI